MAASIFLGNLSWALTDDELAEAISQFAAPTTCEIKRNRMGKSQGFAIATFESPEDAQLVIDSMNGQSLNDREVIAREDRGASKPAPAPAVSNRVFVGNLSWDTSDDMLLEVFQEFNIVGASVQRQPNGSSKGWALAQFASADDAAGAIESFNGADIDGRPVVCRPDRGLPASRGGNGGRQQRQPRTRAPRERLYGSEGPPSTSVFIGNLSWSMNDEGIDELLAEYEVEKASVQTRPDGKSRGFALVTFSSIEEAERAIRDLNGQVVMERPLALKFDAKGGE